MLGLGINKESLTVFTTCHLALSLSPIEFNRNPSSASPRSGNLVLDMLASSSPNRNAALSRLGPDVDLRPLLINVDGDFGGDDFEEESECGSDSSIQLNELINIGQ